MKYMLVMLFLVANVCHANNTFPVDEPVGIQAPMCLDQQSAEVLAKAKLQPTEEVKALVIGKKCGMVQGIVVYRKKVAEHDGWSVWEVQFGQYTLYEATDWKPQKKGVEV